MSINRAVLVIVLFTAFTGISRGQIVYPKGVERVLTKAGSNRPELEKVILYCKKTNDPFKLRAAYFLIENMDIHYSRDYYWENAAGKRLVFNELDYADLSSAMIAFNKIRDANPGLHPHAFKSDDIKTIHAGYLIKTINEAFSTWRQSRSYKHLAFDNFCEYILPYRLSVEPLQDWRQIYNKRYHWIEQKQETDGLKSVLNYLGSDCKSWFSNSFSWGVKKEPLPRLGALQLLLRKKGPCEDICDLVSFTLRSQGIPSSLEFVPYWATASDSHFMNAAFDENMKALPIDAGTTPVDRPLLREPSKVLRITYSKQAGTLASKEPQSNIPPGFLRNLNYIDVTSHYWTTTQVVCPIFAQANPPAITYACVFNSLDWKPTWWTKTTRNKSIFSDMSKGVVYLPAFYQNNQIKPAGYPLAVGYHHQQLLRPNTLDKRSVVIDEDNKHITIHAEEKYTLYYWENKWQPAGTLMTHAGMHKLVFSGVPTNALLLLLPEKPLRKERPFMVLDDGKILWW
jgi:hypothetical protein